MSENEKSVEGLCYYHQYARQFIDLAHGRRKEFTEPDPLERWHYYARDGRTILCDECVGTAPLIITWDVTLADAGIRPWYWWAWELKQIREDVELHELEPEDANPWPDRLAWAKRLLQEARSDGDPDSAGYPAIYFGIKVEIGDERAWALLENPDLDLHRVTLNIEEFFTSEDAFQAAVSTFGIADIEDLTEADLAHLDIDGSDHE
jgi:hypothetical protein